MLTCPFYARQVPGVDVQKTAEMPQLHFANQFTLEKPVENPQAQLLDVELSMPTVEVRQIQFIAGVCGHAVWQQRQVRTVQVVRRFVA